MLSKLSFIRVCDGSGAGWVQAFHLYGGSRRRATGVGGFVKAAVKVVAFYPRARRGKRYRPLRVGFVVRGLVTQVRYAVRYEDGTRCWFLQNATALLRRRGTLRSKQVGGPLSRGIRRRHYAVLFAAQV